MEVNILIIDSDIKMRQLLEEFLISFNYKVDCTDDGVIGIQMHKQNDYDLIILDINIPNLDGYTICKMIRKESSVPIIFVTDINDEKSQIKAFDLLCDDYIIKPFSFNLLIRRIDAILRRTIREEKDTFIEFEKIKLNLRTYSVEIDGNNIDLTLKEFKILKLLISNYPQIVTREKLLDSIWGYDYFGDTRIIDAHIKNIRKKIVYPYIKTVKGIGYTLKKDE